MALRPDSAFLQHQLGLWLTRHDQEEYALLAFSRAVELEPDNLDYRYSLAVTLHDLEQVEAAQKQLETVLSREPANRRARVLLIQYWKETGQLQNVQVLLAELERQNPDDPLLQQGLWDAAHLRRNPCSLFVVQWVSVTRVRRIPWPLRCS